MMLGSLISWWYTAGWAALAQRAFGRARAAMAFFSVGTLAKTLFAPFHQISAGQVRGGFEAQLRAFGDRLFSRLFGAFIRTVFIIVGLLTGLIMAFVAVVQFALWPIVPLLPLAGLALTLIGWVP